MPSFKIYNDDCLNRLKQLPDNCINSLITDPPAGIGLIGLEWDQNMGGRDQWIDWLRLIMIECYRVLKPGGYGVVWAIPRTSHWTATALENSGFIIKDIITHVFGSGFPKSMSVEGLILKSKNLDLSDTYEVTKWIRERKLKLGLTNRDIDKAAQTSGGAAHWTAKAPNVQAQIPSLKRWPAIKELLGNPPEKIEQLVRNHHKNKRITAPSEERAKVAGKWKGWGTALKPASEHWILIQKPISEKNIAANIIKHNVGALNIDTSRIKPKKKIATKLKSSGFKESPYFGNHTNESIKSLDYIPNKAGRFPTNFILTAGSDCCPVQALKEGSKSNTSEYFKILKPDFPFKYASKPHRNEKGDFNSHPTVKPLALMRYLIKLITPPQGVVLDPFMGSGTTGVASLFEGFSFLGIEKENDYFKICQKRLRGISRNNNTSAS